MKNLNILSVKPKRLQEWREYKKGTLLENGLALDEVASYIWQQCDGNNTVSLIIDKVCDVYNVQKAVAQKDTVDCIGTLLEEGALGES